eukprot:Nitzschia sp. Nitz4//scaffold45_size130396//123652//124458//NITZ4_003476-RA/size130396-processed-gene-0.234-mRNA-1//-1//CDS//3329552479//1294//frame0
MGRKSKHAGSGHLPLTNYERNLYGKPYGTTTARLGGSSQYTFGHCALSVHPAKEQPVATPSGFVYERPAILEYLLSQTQKIKQARQRYDDWVQSHQTATEEKQENKRKQDIQDFENSQKVVEVKRQKTEVNPLKQTSYWLSEFQPETSSDLPSTMEPPPKRPSSPMSMQPLRRKDLIELDLKRDKQGKVLCAISDKAISTQQALALIPKSNQPAQVVLEQVFQDLGDDRTCPVTGRTITKILKLQKGGSSFAAAGGVVEAKTYRPSMT